MNSRKTYNTKQKNLILSCLHENQGRHVTVEMIIDYLKDKNESVGQTTVYRNLDKLVKDGVVLKFAAPGGMGACYEYLEQLQSHLNHYHLVCVECGQTIHLHCNHIDQLSAHIQEEHHFSLDGLKTILYGRCESCT